MTFECFCKKFNINLNSQQEEAVCSVEGPVMLLAVPGSGKTTVLVTRLGYMLYCKGIDPKSILTLTYTTSATTSMKDRFKEEFGDEFADELEFRTINGIAQKVLQYYGSRIGKQPYAVADKETTEIIRMAYEQISHEYINENVLKTIQTSLTYVKNMGLNLKQIEEYDCDIDEFPQIFQMYQSELKRIKLIDYDDQIVYALKILKSKPEILDYFQRRYKYYCLDEAQDTSKIQHELLKLLSSKYDNLFMVGDEDQSIYGFRAAYPQELMGFKSVHPDGKILLLEHNYRSDQNIVNSAMRLIKDNTNRSEKNMIAVMPAKCDVRKLNVKCRRDQYTEILRLIKETAGEVAFLYRNNESALPIIDILERNKITYRIKHNDITFFSHPVVTDIIDIIHFSQYPYDTELFMRVYYKIGTYVRREVASSICKSDEHGIPILSAIALCNDVPESVKRQCKDIQNQLARIRNDSAENAILRIVRNIGYQNYSDSRNMDYGKVEILLQLAKNERDVNSLLRRLDELKHIMNEGKRDDEARVILSTIHSSKGLEFEHVVLVDMLEGILPECSEPDENCDNITEINEYEEERRLYYVGMTRAKESLSIFSFENDNTSSFTKRIFGTDDSKRKYRQISSSGHINGYIEYEKYIKKKTTVGDLDSFKIGTRIKNRKYGEGVITSKENEWIDVLFEDGTSRKFNLSIAAKSGAIKMV